MNLPIERLPTETMISAFKRSPPRQGALRHEALERGLAPLPKAAGAAPDCRDRSGMKTVQELKMQTKLTFKGEHAHLASPEEIAAGIHAACEVFARHEADPLACAHASRKLERDEPLTRDEALLCVIWDAADDRAFRAVTLGWLVRDVDIRLAVDHSS